MAKTLMTRPHMAAMCAYGTRFFSCRTLPPYHSFAKLDYALTRLILPEKLGNQRHVLLCGTKSMGLSVGRRSLGTRITSQVNGSGSIDSPLMQSMENKIKEHLNAELVTVKDAYGDGRHVSIDVVSSAFEGQSAVNRQRMVYKAIWEELQDIVHAVDQMTTRTPNEVATGK